jgi:hypothetical protein
MAEKELDEIFDKAANNRPCRAIWWLHDEIAIFSEAINKESLQKLENVAL